MDAPMSKPFNLGGSSCLLRKKGAMLYNLTASRKVALKLTRTSHGMFRISTNTTKSLTNNWQCFSYLYTWCKQLNNMPEIEIKQALLRAEPGRTKMCCPIG